MISLRRQIAAVIFGLVYGGAVVTGVYKGLSYALRVDEDLLADSPILAVAVEDVAAIAMAFLAGYVSRRVIIGTLAGALGSTLILVLGLLPPAGSGPPGRQLGAAIAFALAVPVAFYGSRCPVQEQDLSKGRVLGVSWRHWLWLWLPWQLMIGKNGSGSNAGRAGARRSPSRSFGSHAWQRDSENPSLPRRVT